MANENHVRVLSEGAFVWNKWRLANPDIIPDFTDFNFTRYKTDKDIPPTVSGGERWLENHWDYNSINLINVNLSNALLGNGILSRKHLVNSNFTGADFTGCQMNDTLLKTSNFTNSVFRHVNLKGAKIVNCNFTGSVISDSYIFGISTWDREVMRSLSGSKQSNLIITTEEEDILTVDNIQDANLIYNLNNNTTAARTVDSISNKLVFILGNFSAERKPILDLIKKELRSVNLVPLIFDFDKPENKNLKESVLLFANLSKFIIADLTDGRSVQREMEIIAPHLSSVVIQPIILQNEIVHGLLEDLLELPQFLPLFQYKNADHLIKSLKSTILKSIEKKINALRKKMANK